MGTDIGQLGRIFTSSSAYADPVAWHAAAERIRREQPVLRVTSERYPDFWAITTHADVLEVERHPDVFTNGPLPVITTKDRVAGAAEAPIKTLIQMDGAEHKTHRGIVNEWFKPGSVRRLQERVTELARQHVDRMATLGGECDFVNDVALHFPLHVILSILGLPESDYPRMLQLTQELFRPTDTDLGRGGDSALEVILDFVRYFTELTADRRATPTDDLASVIANARIDGAPIADLDTFGHYVIIATAGHDTTSSSIAAGLLALIQHPDQLALLQAEPDRIDQAADEIVRYTSPVKHFMRTCREPFELHGVTIRPGDLLYLSYASANRDETVFADPHRLDVTRQNAGNHLGFGFGQHFCLGVHLARMEIRTMFRELLPRLRHVELAGEPTWIHANFVQGPKSIPIRYDLV